MVKKREDPRIIRSRNAFIQALSRELDEKKGTQITVSSICRRAGLDRATFYRHFEDKNDIMERGIALIIDELIEATGAADQNDPRFPGRIHRLFMEIEKRKDFLRPFFNSRIALFLESKMKKELFDFIKENRIDYYERRDKNTWDSAVLTTLTVSSLFGLIQYWLVEHTDWTAENLAETYKKFITAGVGSLYIPENHQ